MKAHRQQPRDHDSKNYVEHLCPFLEQNECEIVPACKSSISGQCGCEWIATPYHFVEERKQPGNTHGVLIHTHLQQAEGKPL
jgi:hypothetical protein